MNQPQKTVRDAIKESHTAIQYEQIVMAMSENFGMNRRNRILSQLIEDYGNYVTKNEDRLIMSLLAFNIFDTTQIEAA